jgi:nucleoside phosphorylase
MSGKSSTNFEKLPPEVKPIVETNQPVMMSSSIMRHQDADRVDLGIVIALQEDFRELLSLCGTVSQHRSDKLTVYRFNRRQYRVVAAVVGEMGAAPASRVTERMIDAWHPESIASIGVAAGVHDDLRVGDVYAPTQADEYIQDSNASPNPNDPAGCVFVPGGHGRRTDYKIIDAIRNLEVGHSDIYKRFIDGCTDDLKQLVRDADKRQRLLDQSIIRASVRLLADGHVATGPVAAPLEAFTKWVRSHDRHAKALEMETAGVYTSAQEYGKVTRPFAIRGISDYGDDRKKALDEFGDGVLRRYAMRNAVRLLWAMLDGGALPR